MGIMIRLIITSDDDLFSRLAARARKEGDTPRRATNALDGLQQATTRAVRMIVVDMSLHAADTLVESLHSRPATASIPLFAVKTGERIPLELRRLCTDVLTADAL
jgi:ActR/RegA family two-component response regulator